MRRILAGLALLASCSPPAPPPPAVPPPADPLKTLGLYASDGLYGGTDAWLAENGDYTVREFRKPKPGESYLQERRFRSSLSPEEIRDLSWLLAARRFADIPSSRRLPVPHEILRTLELTLGSGRTAKIRRLHDDPEPSFELVYERLMGFARRAAQGKPDYEGPYDPAWKP